MKVIKYMLAIFVIAMLASGCDVVVEKPNSDIMKQALQIELRKAGVPNTWLKTSVPGKRAIITQLRTKGWGTYDTEHKRWPVKARIVGSADSTALYGGNYQNYPFDVVVEFYIFKDDFGKWKAKIIY